MQSGHWYFPVLGNVAFERLTGEHCAMVFERVDAFNEEIEAAREAGREPLLPGDVRGRTRYTDVATQHRIYGVLRAFLNHQWKRARKITFNPVYAVELGHSTTRITQDLYQHVRHQVHVDSAGKAVDLLPTRRGTRETGS